VTERESPPSFAVVVAAYQATATIAEAVSSALDQTLPPQEVIVCDDGSTDDIAGALERFGERVRLVRVPHGGPGRARNAAAAVATAEFLVILDADDSWPPERLEAIGELARRRPDIDVISTDSWFERDGRRSGRFYEQRGFPVADQRQAILEWCFVHGHAAVRREAWQRAGGQSAEIVHGEDWDLWVRLIHAGATVGCVAEPLATYRIWDGSLSANRAASLAARARVLERAATLPLSPSERAALRASVGVAVRRAAQAELTTAVMAGGPGARARLLSLGLRRGAPPAVRLKAAIAGAVPRLARRWVVRRNPDARSSPIDRVLPGE